MEVWQTKPLIFYRYFLASSHPTGRARLYLFRLSETTGNTSTSNGTKKTDKGLQDLIIEIMVGRLTMDMGFLVEKIKNKKHFVGATLAISILLSHAVNMLDPIFVFISYCSPRKKGNQCKVSIKVSMLTYNQGLFSQSMRGAETDHFGLISENFDAF